MFKTTKINYNCVMLAESVVSVRVLLIIWLADCCCTFTFCCDLSVIRSRDEYCVCVGLYAGNKICLFFFLHNLK